MKNWALLGSVRRPWCWSCSATRRRCRRVSARRAGESRADGARQGSDLRRAVGRRDAELRAAVADPKEPNKDEALFWLAHSQNQAGDFAEAVESIRRLQREFPKSRWSAPAESLLIELAQKLGRRDVLWRTASPPPPPAPPAPPPRRRAAAARAPCPARRRVPPPPGRRPPPPPAAPRRRRRASRRRRHRRPPTAWFAERYAAGRGSAHSGARQLDSDRRARR